MSFSRFKPLSEEEMAELNAPITLGEVDFEIINSVERPSKNGNPMKDLTVRVCDDKGIEKDVGDNWVLTPKAMWKIKEGCLSIGRLDLYENGCIPDAALIGSKGRAIIIEEKYINKNGEERAAIKISKWLPKKEQAEPTPLTADLDDDLQF